MNLTETAQLLTYISAATPGMRMVDGTPAVWHDALADVPAEAALDAVRWFFKSETGFIRQADIRRIVAERAGLFPPSTDEALEQAREYNRWLDAEQSWRPSRLANAPSSPRPDIHPLAHQAAREVGWSTLSSSPAWEERRLFAAAYDWRRKDECGRILEADLTVEIASRSRALPGGGE